MKTIHLTKKSLLLFCLFLTSIFSYGQGIKIYQKNGTVAEYDYAEIDSLVTFDSNQDGESLISANLLYGTWLLINEKGYEEGEYDEDITIPEYYMFDKSGNHTVYRQDRDTEEWEFSKQTIYRINTENSTLFIDDGHGGTDWEILKLTSTELQIKGTWYDNYIGSYYQIQTFKKVADEILYK